MDTMVQPARTPPPPPPHNAVWRVPQMADLSDTILRRVSGGKGVGNVAFIGPSGSYKTWGASALYHGLRQRVGWLSLLSAPWVQASWIALNFGPGKYNAIDGKPIARMYERANVVFIDGLGEEDARGRHYVDALIKARVDAQRALVVTTRLPFDGGQASIAKLFPTLRALVDPDFPRLAYFDAY